MTILIISAVLMLAKAISLLIEINSLTLKAVKSKEITTVPNENEKKFQFIRGLY